MKTKKIHTLTHIINLTDIACCFSFAHTAESHPVVLLRNQFEFAYVFQTKIVLYHEHTLSSHSLYMFLAAIRYTDTNTMTERQYKFTNVRIFSIALTTSISMPRMYDTCYFCAYITMAKWPYYKL